MFLLTRRRSTACPLSRSNASICACQLHANSFFLHVYKFHTNSLTCGRELLEARSRLYRRRFLQVNTRWKALAEIYTMHSFAPFSFFFSPRRFERAIRKRTKQGQLFGREKRFARNTTSSQRKRCTVLESIGEKWGKKGLAKTTPKRKKTRKREANKQRAASHLELR